MKTFFCQLPTPSWRHPVIQRAAAIHAMVLTVLGVFYLFMPVEISTWHGKLHPMSVSLVPMRSVATPAKSTPVRHTLPVTKKASVQAQKVTHPVGHKAQPVVDEKRLHQELADELLADMAESELKTTDNTDLDAAKAQYRQQLLGHVAKHWRVPLDVDQSRWLEVRVYLDRKGHIERINILKSSHDQTLDRSAIKALYASQPLPLPDNQALRQKANVLELKMSPQEITTR